MILFISQAYCAEFSETYLLCKGKAEGPIYRHLTFYVFQVGTGATVATLADASELPTTVTVAQVNYSAVADGEVRKRFLDAPIEVVYE